MSIGGISNASAGFACPTREFQAQRGNTVWGQVQQSLEQAGLLNGLSPAARNAKIQQAVNEVRVLDENGQPIPNKNLIYAGKKYTLEFPGGASTAAGAQAQAATGGNTLTDGFLNNGPLTGGLPDIASIPPEHPERSKQVAEALAKEASTWNYASELEARGRTMQEAMDNAAAFAASERGVCTDMAFRAANLFQQSGIDARVVGGIVQSTNASAFLPAQTTFAPGQVQHAWVEFKGEDGQWHRFDPTAAAQQKNPQAALSADGSSIYLQAFEILDDQNQNGQWQNTILRQQRSQPLAG